MPGEVAQRGPACSQLRQRGTRNGGEFIEQATIDQPPTHDVHWLLVSSSKRVKRDRRQIAVRVFPFAREIASAPARDRDHELRQDTRTNAVAARNCGGRRRRRSCDRRCRRPRTGETAHRLTRDCTVQLESDRAIVRSRPNRAKWPSRSDKSRRPPRHLPPPRRRPPNAIRALQARLSSACHAPVMCSGPTSVNRSRRSVCQMTKLMKMHVRPLQVVRLFPTMRDGCGASLPVRVVRTRLMCSTCLRPGRTRKAADA
jgi:hypothetical protein